MLFRSPSVLLITTCALLLFLKNKIRLIDTEDKLVVAREEGSWVVGKMGEGDQEVQSSSYKIHKSWGSNVQHMRYSQ